MSFCWKSLPHPVQYALLSSGVGKGHLLKVADLVERAGRDAASASVPSADALWVKDCLLAAWEADPLDVFTARRVLAAHEQEQFLAPEVAGLLRYCARQAPPDEATVQRVTGEISRHPEHWQIVLTREHGAGGPLLYLLGQAVYLGLRDGAFPWLQRFVDRAQALPRPLRLGLAADLAFAQQRWLEAAQGYAAAFAACPLPTWQVRQAESLCRGGDRAGAVALWRSAHATRPWQVNTLLRLSDILENRDRTDTPFPPGQGFVLLYSWNKAEDLDATLGSLLDSELHGEAGKARVIVLDNGSTDATPDMLRRREQDFQGRMSVVTLPVNVGAPAARNWLLALPEVRQAPWVAFLDDDVLVPRHWLRQLWAGLQRWPAQDADGSGGAGVCGGHAVDFHAPLRQQWTDMHLVALLPEDEIAQGAKGGQGAHPHLREHFGFSSPHLECPDFGEFNVMRPCVTVIGCCHLFTRAALDATGHFDLRFSPSQSDDVDHDLRQGLAGRFPVFNGHVRVLHKRSSGYTGNAQSLGNASGICNWYKLQASYSPAQIAALMDSDRQRLLDDVLWRLERLRAL